MRIAYVDVNLKHVNPTANLLPLLFAEHFSETSFYGAGYVPFPVLERGLMRWLDDTGPYDAIVIGANTPILDTSENYIANIIKYIQTYTFCGAEKEELEFYFKDAVPALHKLHGPLKLLSTLNLDSYACTAEQVDKVEKGDFILLGPNSQFSRPLAEWLHKNEIHYERKKSRLSDAWHDYLHKNPRRVITAVHFIGAHELDFTPLAKRKWDIAVPGASYSFRSEASRELKASKLHVAPKHYFNIYRLLNKIGAPVFSSTISLQLYSLLFQRTLSTSKMTFTAPAGSGNMVRKFMEIPAAGSTLVGIPCNGWHELGYLPGKHYVHAEPTQLVEVVREQIKNPDLQLISANGQQLTIAQHSVSARAKQIKLCLEAIKRGGFCGAHWDSGKFVVDKSSLS